MDGRRMPKDSWPTEFTKLEKRIIKSMGYTLGELLGSGSYARVYKSEFVDPKAPEGSEDKLPHKLACKVINIQSAPLEIAVKFVPRELDLMPKLDHKHIIRTHSILFIPDVEKYYIFMQLGENGDVLSFIIHNGALRERRAQIFFRQLLSALEYLFSRKIAHRDIKCENILLTKGYNIKLSDFGFAKICEVDTETEQVIKAATYCGSLQYTAPEVIRGEPYNPFVSDIFSSGVFLYVILNQALPFEETKRRALYIAQMKKQWTWRSAVNEDITDALKSFLPRLLQPRPEKRATIPELLVHPWIRNDVVTAKSSRRESQSLMTLRALPSAKRKFTPIASHILRPNRSSIDVKSLLDSETGESPPPEKNAEAPKTKVTSPATTPKPIIPQTTVGTSKEITSPQTNTTKTTPVTPAPRKSVTYNNPPQVPNKNNIQKKQ